MKKIKIILFFVFFGLLCLTTTVSSVMLYARYNNFIDRETKHQLVHECFGNIAHGETVIALADYLQVDYIIALAVAGVESDYCQYACSSARARGYFGLMYDTARYVGTKYKIQIYNKYSIYDSSNNIFFGMVHLKGLIDYYGLEEGLELYNVGIKNYTVKGKRSKEYIEKVKDKISILREREMALKSMYKKTFWKYFFKNI
jgi:soluble lytic murein transglycosylase-like protein